MNEFSIALIAYKEQKRAFKEAENQLFSMFRCRKMMEDKNRRNTNEIGRYSRGKYLQMTGR